MTVFQRSYNARKYLLQVPLLFAIFCTAWEWESDFAIWSLSIGLVFVGVCVRAWALQHCRYGVQREKELATSGPYQYVRNPLYLGNLLIGTGAIVSSELLWFLPLFWGWFFFFYQLTILHEEKRLLLKYGAVYLDYKKNVPRWFPRIPLVFEPAKNPERNFFSILPSQGYLILVLFPFMMKELISEGILPF